jgi:hypothetical protein
LTQEFFETGSGDPEVDRQDQQPDADPLLRQQVRDRRCAGVIIKNVHFDNALSECSVVDGDFGNGNESKLALCDELDVDELGVDEFECGRRFEALVVHAGNGCDDDHEFVEQCLFCGLVRPETHSDVPDLDANDRCGFVNNLTFAQGCCLTTKILMLYVHT